MSVPFTPGVEQGTSLEGNIELDESDIVDYEFTEKQLSRQQLRNAQRWNSRF